MEVGLISEGTRLNRRLLGPRDIIPLLGKGEAHWKEGYSAHTLTTTWWQHTGLPPSVRSILDSCPAFAGAELVDAFFERKTDLRDGFSTASQTDLLAIVRISGALAVIAVEGKVEESFGPMIGHPKPPSEDHLSTNQRSRLMTLQRLLGVTDKDVAALRYQLFHRAAAAVFEAERYACGKALLLVQSFSPSRTGHADFAAFTSAIGLGAAEPGRLLGPLPIGDVQFYAGWLADRLPPTA